MPLIHRCEGYASRLEMTFAIKKKLKVETVLKHFIRVNFAMILTCSRQKGNFIYRSGAVLSTKSLSKLMNIEGFENIGKFPYFFSSLHKCTKLYL